MVAAVINETLKLLDMESNSVESIPCEIALDDRKRLIVFTTLFGYPSFTIAVVNNSAVKWTDSDVVEFFIDDDTQYFIEQHQAALTKTQQFMGFSVTYAEEQIQVYNLVAVIREGMDLLDRFITDFTSI